LQQPKAQQRQAKRACTEENVITGCAKLHSLLSHATWFKVFKEKPAEKLIEAKPPFKTQLLKTVAE